MLSIIVTAALVGLGAYYYVSNPEELAPLGGVGTMPLLQVSALLFLFFVTTGLTFYLLVRLVAVRLDALEVLGLTFLTNFVNYLAPTRPGAAAKAVYLKIEKRLPYAVYTSVFAANAFLVLLVSGLAGLGLVFVWWQATANLLHELAFVCLAISACAALPFVLPIPSFAKPGRFMAIMENAARGFEAIKTQRIGMLGVCVSVLLQFVVSAFLMQVTYTCLGQPLDFTTALIIGVFTSIANFFTLTPNNIGVQELVMGYLFTMTGLSFSEGVLGGALIRAVHVVLTFGLTPVLVYLMLRRSRIGYRELVDPDSGDRKAD